MHGGRAKEDGRSDGGGATKHRGDGCHNWNRRLSDRRARRTKDSVHLEGEGKEAPKPRPTNFTV